MALGMPDEAARVLRLACRLRANSARPYVAFGRLFLQAGQVDRAVQALGMALRLERKADDVSVELGMSEAAERQERWDEAFEWCLHGLARVQAHPELLDRAAGSPNARAARRRWCPSTTPSWPTSRATCRR